jgi:protoporphyrinogen IX oxidase
VAGRWRRAIVSLAVTAAFACVLFVWRPSGLYLWLKAAHVVAVIAWMAGMFHLPRLFAYHCAAAPGSRQSETFKIMEHRLLTVVVNPAMVVVWAIGLWLAHDGGWLDSHWLQAKFAFVVMLSGVHGLLVRQVRAFAADANRHGPEFYRIINAVSAVLMAGIVVLVIVKPF